MPGIDKTAQVDAYQQETEWSCSAATLKAAAAHWGFDVSEKAAVEAIGARKGRGAETDEIVAGAQKLGFDSWEKSFKDLDEAKETLRQGIPIIADVQSFNYPGKGHYVLIAGWKPGKGFIIMDPNTKGKTAVANWRVLSEEEMEKRWWDRAMAPPHKLMPKWGVMIKPKEKEKTANYGAFLQAQRRAKMESATVPRGAGEYGKFAEGDKEPDGLLESALERGPASPLWGAAAGGAAGTAVGSITGAQAGLALQHLKENKRTVRGLGRLTPKFIQRLGRLRRLAESGVKGGTVGTAVGIPVGASIGYKIMRGHDRILEGKEKKANGDMLDYFQKHPQKYKEYLARQEAKKARKEKRANDPIKKKIKVQGIDVWLEWLKGEERTYYNHDPLKKSSKGTLDYKTKMKADYGYVPKRWDADGEDLDVYLGPNHESEKVFIIKQIRPSDGSFDEHKIMLGYDSKEEAEKSYLAHMPKKFFGSIRASNIESFKKEFLMGKARFQKKAFSSSRAARTGGTIGVLGGGLGAYLIDKKVRERQDKIDGSKDWKSSKAIPVLGGVGGALSGAELGETLGAMKDISNQGKRYSRLADEARKVNRLIRNPIIAGALIGGGGAAGISALKARAAHKAGREHEGYKPWEAAALGALHGGSLGSTIGRISASSYATRQSQQRARDRAGGGSAREAPPTSYATPEWAQGAKTQKEVKQRMREQARKHHPDVGGSDEVMKRINQEWADFQKNPKFRQMSKEAFNRRMMAILRGHGAR